MFLNRLLFCDHHVHILLLHRYTKKFCISLWVCRLRYGLINKVDGFHFTKSGERRITDLRSPILESETWIFSDFKFTTEIYNRRIVTPCRKGKDLEVPNFLILTGFFSHEERVEDPQLETIKRRTILIETNGSPEPGTES